MAVYKDGKYYRVRFMYNGQMHIKSSRSTRKADAVALEAKMRTDLVNKKELGKKQHIKLFDAIDNFTKSSKNSGAYESVVTATRIFRKYFDNRNLDDFTSRDLYNWVQNERCRGIKDITIRLWSRQFNKICQWAKKMGYHIPDYEWCEFHVKDKQIRFLTDDEEQKVLNELTTNGMRDPSHIKGRQDARMMFILMIDSGMRIGEASKLKWSDINFRKNLLHVYHEKTDKEDFIPMSNRLRVSLQKRERVNVYVFPSRDGNSHKSSQNNQALYGAFKRAGLPDVTPHVCRKTFGTKLLNNGVDLVTIQHLLGHASLRTTEKAYTVFLGDEKYKSAINTLNETTKPQLKVVR